MNKVFSTWIISALILSSFNFGYGQTKEAEQYRQESEDMRKQVWAWKLPAFQKRDIPSDYTNASKVILAYHIELTADSKSKIKFSGLSVGRQNKQNISEIARELIKINDKTAVAEYSELNFTQFERSSGFRNSTTKTISKSYVGIRVIKPNGNVKEINADDIVLTRDESAEKKAKLAIPDLQPGDMLDYFIAVNEELTDEIKIMHYNVDFFDEAPILNLSFHGQLGKKFAVDYRSYNGAPQLKVNKNDDEEIIIDVEKNNIPPFETSLWVSPGLELPFTRMNISLGVKIEYRDITRSEGASRAPGEITDLSASATIQNSLNADLNQWYSYFTGKELRREIDELGNIAEKKAKQLGLKYKDLSMEDKAALLFYTLRFTQVLNFNIDRLSEKINVGNYTFKQNKRASNLHSMQLLCALRAGDIDVALLVSGSRDGVRMNEGMTIDEPQKFVYLAGTKKFLALESVYDVPFTTPAEIEGFSDTKSFRFPEKKYPDHTGFTVPVTNVKENVHIEDLKLLLAPDKINLAVARTTTLKGHYKVSEQKNLILYEDFYESERKAFKEDRSLIEELEDHKKSRKDVDEVKNAFAEARKNQRDAFITEAKGQFDQEITELKDYKIDNMGVRHTAPDFVYSSSFNLGGLVKKAGNNMILEIGKIQGDPFIIKREHRKRDIDIYMPFARSIEFNIDLQIPDGYTVEGISSLNKKVENECGSFTAEASATDKIVTIKLKKQYLHNFEPAKNWDKLLEFMDAASDWGNSKLLLKKK